jgi:hypothetical protein
MEDRLHQSLGGKTTMADMQRFPLQTASGATGFVLRRARFLDRGEKSLVRLDDGREFEAPSEALRVQSDGSFFLQDVAAPERAGERPVAETEQIRRSVPPEDATVQTSPLRTAPEPPSRRSKHHEASREQLREQPKVDTRPSPPPPVEREQGTSEEELSTAAPNRSLPSQEITLDDPLFSEEVSVERVVVDRMIDEVPQVRQEGDVLVIPVVEEVITVQKRLLLKEEVRVSRRRNELRVPRRVVVNGTETRVIGSDGREIRS